MYRKTLFMVLLKVLICLHVLWQSLSINEFLKPAEGEKYYSPGGRGRGRGRGARGGYGGGNRINDVAAPAIEDVGQFPSLGVKWVVDISLGLSETLPFLFINLKWCYV